MTPQEHKSNGLNSYHLALATIRKRLLLLGKDYPHDETERRWLDWEVR